ncbi:uncharacterized protein UV8b_02217 [Ustilaginoidea virens]|uniref:Uncharacterized protein n=1 Tax=Ustilaginoidea virens TaxID=1159556 RepID=A0A8E5MFX3_USTVR|nr:uncharacterized protein UV8b_02217 [Ustilaginoidea virens]QUC17976.1 hypothetical protein UV8b_02217 [Ustilaginoidea virens]
MPRDPRHCHNGPFTEAGKNIFHGPDPIGTDKVPRADKTADMPEGSREKGAGLEGMNASGGQSQGIKHGDGVGQGGRARKN